MSHYILTKKHKEVVTKAKESTKHRHSQSASAGSEQVKKPRKEIEIDVAKNNNEEDPVTGNVVGNSNIGGNYRVVSKARKSHIPAFD